MQDTVLCQRYGTTGGIKQTGSHNRSENCRSAWVAMYTQPTHSDTEAPNIYPKVNNQNQTRPSANSFLI
jgi:hypothetical protein